MKEKSLENELQQTKIVIRDLEAEIDRLRANKMDTILVCKQEALKQIEKLSDELIAKDTLIDVSHFLF